MSNSIILNYRGTFREEVQKSGATYAGDKGLSAGLTPPALQKK